MKMDIVAGSQKDEFYTPKYAVMPILKYISKQATIWCPFDTEESYFVKEFKSNGNKVITSHISGGQDFFNYEPQEHIDYVISNPPYTKKGDVLQRLFDLEVKFAMLVGVVGLFESQKRFEMFKNNDFEIMYFNKRISYFESYSDEKPKLNPPFSSVYLCHGVLPKQIVFEYLNNQMTTDTLGEGEK